jgi:hypothetical protein
MNKEIEEEKGNKTAKGTQRGDSSEIDIFYGELQRKYVVAIKQTTEARKCESDRETRYTLWEQAYISYFELNDYIVDNLQHVKRARAKSYRGRFFSVLGWVISFILGIISVALGIG